jgi:hypothetical protein
LSTGISVFSNPIDENTSIVFSLAGAVMEKLPASSVVVKVVEPFTWMVTPLTGILVEEETLAGYFFSLSDTNMSNEKNNNRTEKLWYRHSSLF